MKYFNPSYWLKPILLSAYLFETQAQQVSKKFALMNACIHESGHAINIMESKFKDTFKNITIYQEPTTKGFTYSESAKEYSELDNEELEEKLRIIMGGAAAETVATTYYSKEEIEMHAAGDIFIGQKIINEILKRMPFKNGYIKEYRKLLLDSAFTKAVTVVHNNYPKFKEIVQKCYEFGGYVSKRMFHEIDNKYSKKINFNADTINSYENNKDFSINNKKSLTKIEL